MKRNALATGPKSMLIYTPTPSRLDLFFAFELRDLIRSNDQPICFKFTYVIRMFRRGAVADCMRWYRIVDTADGATARCYDCAVCGGSGNISCLK